MLKKIKNRLPRRLRALFVYKRDKNCPLEVALYQRVKVLRKHCFIPSRSYGDSLEKVVNNIFKVLCDLYTDEKNPNLFDFDGIKLVKPETQAEEGIFTRDAIDIILPNLKRIKNKRLLISYEDPYEYKNVQISPNNIVVDCGANVGLFSAMASNKGAKVRAFEAIPSIIDRYLSKTAAINSDITIVNLALSDKSGELTFYEDFGHIGGSSYVIERKNSKEVKVQAVTLDEYVKEHNIQKIDFIKADIEGAERNLLLGAKTVLKEFAPQLSICTYHLPDDPRVIRKIILDANPKYKIIQVKAKLYAYVP